mgnify:CR=1 FL=1
MAQITRPQLASAPNMAAFVREEQITDFVTSNSQISKETFLEYMMATGQIATDVGTIVYGREAVESGLIDRLGSLHEALEVLHGMIQKRKERNVEKG